MGGDTYSKWMQRIREGLAFRKKEGRDSNWQLAYEYFRCQYPPEVDTENMVFSVGTQLVSETTPENPRVVITAIRPGQQAAALVLQQVINQLFSLMRLPPELERSGLDAFLYGPFIQKIGYDSVYGYAPEKEEMHGGTTTMFDKKGNRIEFFPKTAPGMPWTMRLAPWDLVVPWGSVTMEEAPWVATRHIRYLEDVKRDEKYSKAARGKLQPSRWVRGEESVGLVGLQEESADSVVVLWQCYDRETDRVIVLACDNEDVILRDEPSVELQVLGDFPLIVEMANENGRVFWGDGDFVQIRGNQESLNSFKTQANEHARGLVARVLLHQDKIEEDDIKALLSGIPNAMVRVRRGANVQNLDEVMRSFTTEYPLGLLAAQDAEKRSIRETVGYSTTTLGENAGPPRRTAQEVLAMQVAHGSRIGRRRKLVERVIVKLARAISRMVFALWKDQQVVQVIGPQGMPYWVEFRGNELAAEYGYEVVSEDREKETTVQRRTEALAFLQQLPVMAQMGVDTKYAMSVIMRYFPEFDPTMVLQRQATGPVGIAELQAALMGGETRAPVRLPMQGVPEGV